ncbi:MAG: DNA-protecting protein DprA [Clostridium lundense]|nr:DNA-protecting protein DprA [Clostridium lundense]
MEKTIYIALQLMGLNNKVLTDIIKLIPNKELKQIFRGNVVEFQYKYNIDFSRYLKLFNDSILIENSLNKAKNILKINKELRIRTVLINSRFYPGNLKKMDNAPAILYIKGKNITKLDEKAVACVGTRTPTIFGIKAANSIVGSLAKENFSIISGLALGIDAESHKACLNVGGRTIAILAHGLDMIYPRENIELSKSILNNGGTLISEYPVGTKPDKFRFVDRNRIVSGLSKGTIVFETKEKSGTMHTVDYTLKQQKKVFCPIPLKQELQTSGLIKLLNENKAIGIKTKDNYDVIVHELGYKIKYDTKAIIKNKSENINKLITLDNNILNDIVSTDFDKRASFGIEKELYSKFKNILKENNLTSKEFFYGVIKKVVGDYKKGGKNE